MTTKKNNTTEQAQKNAVAFLIGYFLILYPLRYAMESTIIDGLIHGIIGLGLTLIFYKISKEML